MSINPALPLIALLGLAGPTWADAPPELSRETAAPAETHPEHTASGEPERARPVSSRWAPKRLPRGDLRHCLELQDNDTIIRCAEKLRR